MSAAKREDEGQNLLVEAEKKLQAKSGFLKSLFSSSSNGAEEAAELFARAANQFKLAKAWIRAGDAFSRSAEAYESLGSSYSFEAASKHAEAGKMYKNAENVTKAVGAFENAVRVYTEGARFQQCARYTREIAELHHSAGNMKAARKAYSQAADFYDGEDSKSNANTMRLNVAKIDALDGEHAFAAKLFEEIGKAALDSRLLKYGARDHFLCAGLCYCIDDQVAASQALDRYREIDTSFPCSREDDLLAKIVAALADSNVESFTNAVYEFDRISKLDDWKTTILLKIKGSIRDAEDDLT